MMLRFLWVGAIVAPVVPDVYVYAARQIREPLTRKVAALALVALFVPRRGIAPLAADHRHMASGNVTRQQRAQARPIGDDGFWIFLAVGMDAHGVEQCQRALLA